ncbi:hypothetical protein AaE_015172, partial [Aphanomyces astaci]
MGPGNILDGAPAQNFADEFALEHDTLYGEFEKETGQNAKYVWVEGIDDVFVEKMAMTRYNAYEEGAYQAFMFKRKLADSGIIPKAKFHKKKQGSFSKMDEAVMCILHKAKDKSAIRSTLPEWMPKGGSVNKQRKLNKLLMLLAGATAGNPAESVTPVDIPRAIFTHPFQDTVTVSLPYLTFVNLVE